MKIDETNLWEKIRLGEDSELELKEVSFRSSSKIGGPRRDDLADELAAFANSEGGWLVLGVSDDRSNIQQFKPGQLDALVDFVSEICSDSIKPSPNYYVRRLPTPSGGGILLVEIPRGNTVHRSPGGYFQRRGDTKRQMTTDDIRRLSQSRGQSDAMAHDTQIVQETGINTLETALWRQYVSSRSNDPPETALSKLKFLKQDMQGTLRATVGGVLLSTEDPRKWLPNAYIQAVHYNSTRMDGNRQIDAQDITGPLDRQIRDAMRFVIRNRRVAARKDPARTDMPQYGERAVFEAIVNAVVHRDYAVSGSKIRLFMFDDRLELYSPGGLCNSMTPEDLRISQFTRNELLASRLGQCLVGEVPGVGDRQYFIERRGEGIAVIEDETFSLTGKKPVFELIGEREMKLTLPAASPPLPDGLAVRIKVCRGKTGEPLQGAHTLMIYPNKTYKEAQTDAFGHADFAVHSRLPMSVLCAAPGFKAHVESGFMPDQTLEVQMQPMPNGGSLIIPQGTGHLPGIQGRLNPKLDTLDRTYLYADNVAINDGMQQPVHFALNEPLRLTDSAGTTATLWFREIIGASSVFDYGFEVSDRSTAKDIDLTRYSQGRQHKDASFPVAPPKGELPSNYAAAFAEIKERIRTQRVRIVLAANEAMVLLYWDIGRAILARQESEGWGAKVIDRLSRDLGKSFPDMKGLSPAI